MTVKICTTCGDSKSLEEFNYRTDTKTYRSGCKICESVRHAEYYKEFIKREKILNPSGMKACIGCREEKPYSEFGKKKIEKDGHNRRCRPCYTEYNRILIARNKKKEKVLNSSGTKECLFCGEEKSYEEFGIKPETKDGCYVYCKKCVNFEAKERRLENVEQNKGKKINLMETKYCSGCDEDKVKGDFNKNAHKADGLRSRCRECEKIERDEWYSKYRLKDGIRKYGLTLQDYNDMMRLQSGRCAICETNTKSLVVDHCHVCGLGKIESVRGLVCQGCNMKANYSLDYPHGLLSKAISYSMVHWNQYHRENPVGTYEYGITK